jgi:hypothetical protein
MRKESSSFSNRFFALPGSRLGWMAIGLAAASILLIITWSILKASIPGFLCGLAGGVLALVAILHQKERSWLLFVSILPLVFVIIFILGEFLFPH